MPDLEDSRIMKLTDVQWAGDGAGDEMLLDVAPVTLSVLVRGRNAWHSTWVRHWFKNSHLFSDHQSAQLGAESLRGPGNVFYVNDVPALLLVTEKTQIAVIDGIRGEPFKGFLGIKEELVESAYGSYLKGIRPGVSVREAIDDLRDSTTIWANRPNGNDQVRFGVIPDGCTLAALPRGRFAASTSYPQGSGYRLGWSKRENSLIKTSCQNQSKAWRELLDGMTGVDNLAKNTDLASDPAARVALAPILEEHRAHKNADVGSLDSIRREYEQTLERARQAMEGAEELSDRLREAEEAAEEAVWEAEEFAEDPWSSLGDIGVSSEDVRKARERASSAQLLLEQARAHHEATTEAAQRSQQAWLDARRDYFHLVVRRPSD